MIFTLICINFHSFNFQHFLFCLSLVTPTLSPPFMRSSSYGFLAHPTSRLAGRGERALFIKAAGLEHLSIETQACYFSVNLHVPSYIELYLNRKGLPLTPVPWLKYQHHAELVAKNIMQTYRKVCLHPPTCYQLLPFEMFFLFYFILHLLSAYSYFLSCFIYCCFHIFVFIFTL